MGAKWRSVNGPAFPLTAWDDAGISRHIAWIPGEMCLHLNNGTGGNYTTIFEMFTAQKEQTEI